MPPLLIFGQQFNMQACVFIDGENLRYSLIDLFADDFAPSDYLPRKAAWDQFFDHVVSLSPADNRLRAYWYVVDEIEFNPWRLSKMLKAAKNPPAEPNPGKRPPIEVLGRALSRFHFNREKFEQARDDAERDRIAIDVAELLLRRERSIKNRFDGWRVFQNAIADKNDSIEFRRSGSIQYNLFNQRFGREKAVDVHLATDLLKLQDIYDVAIIVSGDADYVPAVQAIKDSGKRSINVSFFKKDGRLLPGGARLLNRATDQKIQIQYTDMRSFMGI